MKIHDNIKSLQIVTGGMLETNCYLFYMEEINTIVIIDPGAPVDMILEGLTNFPKEAKKTVLLTHGHVDHITSIPKLLTAIDVETIYLHPQDEKLYFSPANQVEPFIPAVKELPEVCKTFPIANDHIKLIHTPGHTKGSVCFFMPKYLLLFSGDTLFQGTIGRTDLPGGSFTEIIFSIKNKLLCLPQQTLVFPGHGNSTTIKSEIRNFTNF